ncbi:ATP-dependent DNA helicase [Cellulomonas sp. HZM]|uniref:ATP-dependent DNA helicase n=1 Tax=Cellulomonas sp. HZM TaxID=1454010 RepID=UPI0009DE2901|nr:ATP-dependent DNA helicase [Cellulomonas sp. HZM]
MSGSTTSRRTVTSPAAGTDVILGADDIAELTGKPLPTEEQRAVVESPLLPALVVAGAGSGKTETMASRVVWLIANGLVEPEQVLGLTFTRKAAGELAERVRRRLRLLHRRAAAEGIVLPGHGAAADGLARPTISTYNSYAASLVVDHALRLGLDPSARLLGEAAQFQLASEVVEAWDEDLGTAAATSTVVDAVLAMSGALDEHLLDPAQAQQRIAEVVQAIEATPPGTKGPRQYAAIASLVASLGERVRLLDVVAAYRARKRAADAIDFGDQVALAARLARDVPEVGAAERDRFRVVLLDEYQDTSFAQLTLLRSLFGGGHAVTAVGDPHQSIYGWRGASAGGLAGFPTDFPVVRGSDHRPAAVHLLSTSWRNDEAVLAAANAVASPLRAGEGRVAVPVLRARPGAGPGSVRANVLATADEEARAVAEFVAEHWRPARAANGAEPAVERVTAAVLCRKRSQFEPLRRALRERGIPVEVVGLGGLLSVPEVVDLVALLQAAHDPRRGDALVRLLTGARTRLGAADLHALAAWATHLAGRAARDRTDVEIDAVDERSLVDALDELPPPGWQGPAGRTLTDSARGRLRELASVLRSLRAHSYLAVPELVGEAERLLGLDIEVAARAGSAPAQARAHLDAFRDVAVEFARTSDHPTLGGFLAWLEAADARENGLELPIAEPDPDAVQITTIHAAKGLEWDVVAVPGLVDGGLPSTRTKGPSGATDSAWLVGLANLPYPLRGDRAHLPDFAYSGAADPKDLEDRRKAFVAAAGEHEVREERRLAYVALTRARRDLLLTASYWGDGKTPRAVSEFLDELVEGGVVEVVDVAPEPVKGDVNPTAGDVLTAPWPADPFQAPGGHGASRRPAVERAAQWVRDAVAEGPDLPAGTVAGASDLPDGPGWEALAARLLDERRRRGSAARAVELPAHLSASALVRLGGGADEFARDLRRPVPNEPSSAARLGTRFHAWVEGYFGSAALVDVDALPGADDADEPPVDLDADVATLRAAFLAGEWAHRSPVAIEVDVETDLDGYVLRSRIDAVFPDPRDRSKVVVVDWKTGAPPRDPQVRAAREIQLAVYRLAWSRRTGVPLADVSAAFCYVAAGETVYPQRLLVEDEIVELLRGATTQDGAQRQATGTEPAGGPDAR